MALADTGFPRAGNGGDLWKPPLWGLVWTSFMNDEDNDKDKAMSITWLDQAVSR